MGRVTNILLLAGSAEARQIARELHGQGRQVSALISEPLKGANPMPVPFRMWDFSQVEALALEMSRFDAVIDASHGFDGVMSAAGFEAASKAGVPFVTLSRPKWDVRESPLWQSSESVTAAMKSIPKGARVFSATGWASLPDYADFPGAALLLRQTSHHERQPMWDFVTLVFGDPPFRVADEIALFRTWEVDLLICRNLGGAPSRPKLDAAKELGLRVILIDGPNLPDGANVVSDVDAALQWIDAL